jgi:pyruvate dehydrogenase E2 component (dihydrolipoamide acetyltransferase)
VRRFAREHGVELAGMAGSGPGGRITLQDVKRRAATAQPAPGPEPPSPPPPAVEAASGRAAPGKTERRPLSEIRRAAGEAVARSWAAVPHLWQYGEADITELEAVRARYGASRGGAGSSPSVTTFVVKAAVAALKDHPAFNASLDTASQELILKKYYNVGVTVDTPDGHLVPVIRAADRMSVVEVAAHLTAVEQRAQAGAVDREELTDATFTVARLGSAGGPAPTPLVTGSAVALLGIGEPRENAAGRVLLPLCLAGDRRVIGEGEGEQFLSTVGYLLSHPIDLLLW